MTRSKRSLVAAASFAMASIPLRAQIADDHLGMGHATIGVATDSSVANAVLKATAAATAKFADRRVAVAAGYRRVGMDFPSMGEHWINPSMLVTGSFDASSPAILTYATIDGQPRLLGVVYAAVLAPGEKAPSFPGGAAVWHEHNGSIDEESLLPEHAGHEHEEPATATSQGTRLAILHAWTVLSNPAGMFAAENWALPFARNGIKVPSQAPISAARELALISGGEEFYRKLFSISSSESGALAEAREAQLQRAIGEGRATFASRSRATELSPIELDALAAVWDRFAAAVSSK